MILTSPLLESAGFEHGFGTKRSTSENFPMNVHILLQVHGERIVVLTENKDTETRRHGGTGKIDNTNSPSPPHPLSHSHAEVVHMALPESHFRFSEGDAMVTDIPGTAIGIRTADCLPVLIGDTATGAVAAIHCGWRSLALSLAGKGANALLRITRSEPGKLVAALGPSIGPCCYEVGEEVRDSFSSENRDGLFEERKGSPYLDLAAGAKTQLLAEGMAPESIEEITGCTSCDEEMFWSWRARKDEEERMISWIKAAKK